MKGRRDFLMNGASLFAVVAGAPACVTGVAFAQVSAPAIQELSDRMLFRRAVLQIPS